MHEPPQSPTSGELRFRRLFELSRRLVVSLNLDDILQATVDGVATLAGLDTAAVYLLENDNLRLCSTTPPLPPQFPDELRNASVKDHILIRRAIETAAPLYISDVAHVSLSGAEQSVVEQRNLRTLLFLPLIAETEVMGALIVGSVGIPMSITDVQIDLSQTLANFAALAVKNARLYQAGQKYAAALEQTLDERKKAEAEREKLREQLIQAQKMEAIGQLAGGIAHDFNNMLCGIIGNAELITEITSPEEIRQLAGEIISISRRSADLTSQLLAFSRKGQVQIVSVDLHKLIEDAISILRHTISRSIEIKTVHEAEPHCTSGDPAQIQSAFLNLCLNARDAMPEGGELVIHTRNVYLNTDSCLQHTSELIPGHYIEILVTDTGCGMDAATLEHIFEPFFTTKKQGEGTGMGLSAVYGTMMTHGGAISVDSNPGQGSTFKLFFPVENRTTSRKSIVEPAVTGVLQDPPDTRRNSKRILIIDDEVIVAKVASRYLEDAGYKVDVYNDSVAALSFFEKNHTMISLVILDLIMPKMDGPMIFSALKTINPEVLVIVSSGFNINGAARTMLGEGAKLFIQKPYLRNDLINAVTNVLGT